MQCGRGCGPRGRACPFPLPPASCLWRGWAGPQPASSPGLARSLGSVNGRQCVRPAVCSGRLIFSLSFAVPQFKLVTHKSSLQLSSGHSGPVLTLSNAAGSSPFRPHLLVAGAGVWGTFLLGVAFRHVNLWVLFIFPLPVRLPSEVQKLPPDPPV